MSGLGTRDGTQGAIGGASPLNFSVFFYFLRPHMSLYAVLFIVMIVSSGIEALGLAALFPLLSSLAGETGEELTGIRRAVTMLSDLVPFDDPIVAAAVVLVVVFAARAFFGFLRAGLIAYSSGRVLFDIKNQLIEGYSKSSYQFFLENKLGTLIYRGVVAPAQVATLMRRLPQMAAETLKALAILTVLVMIFPSGVVVLGGLGFVYYQAISYLSRKVSYNIGRERADVRAEEHVVANELIMGIRQMVAFCTTVRWVERFRSVTRRYIQLWTKDLIWLEAPKQLMEFSAVLVILGLLFVLRYQASGNLSSVLPELGIFAAGLVQLMPIVTELGRTKMEVVGILPEVEAIHAALVLPRPPLRTGGRPFTDLNTGITFRDVHFSHAGREPLLVGLNLTFDKGRVMALVGTSGSGKSTIVNLLLGLYEPTGGTILVDEAPLADYDLESWRRAIGFVSQDPFLIHGTVTENITFGREGYSDEAVVASAELANADSFIQELPEKYQTLVGERGMKLSGGQQQRLCLARALLSNPPLLLLDEATSSLDSISEHAIQQTIREISRDRTVIQIAHRASTVERADQIVVLHQGRIVEKGSHVDLLQSNGEYAKLFATANQ